MILSFDDFELDTEHYTLYHQGQILNVEPLVFNLLVHFARHPDQVFSRDDLIKTVWTGRLVSDATVSTCVKNARKALGDSGDKQTYLKTVRGRGFRFTAQVSQQLTRPPQRVSLPTATARHTNTMPSLLVLPFRTLSEQATERGLADGLAVDLNTILTRIPLLRLSAQTARYRGHAVTPSIREIHEDLGVSYVLEGSVQKSDRQFRINVQLSDAKSGFRLWAEQFMFSGSGSEALDKGVIAIIAKLEPQLHRALYNSVRATDGEPNARELYLEASGILALKGWHHDSFSTAANLLRRSWQREPEFALAPSYLALVMGLGQRIGLMVDRDKAKAEALEAAERSLLLDNMDSTVLGLSGCALADIGQVDRSIPILRNAVELNPANAQAWAALGAACLLQKRIDEAITHLRHGIRISPLDSRLSIWGALLAITLMLAKDIDGARQQGEWACQRDDRSYLPRVVLAAVNLVDNDQERALKALNDAYRIKPDLSSMQIEFLVGRTLGKSLLELKQSAPFSP
ncbi:MAG: winged helix-turn-helix domain-containing protein [Candidatus Competibacteraceae bacterium]|nr:winged helix-turn-helix domain-containing protein [Candidatus Competibacteraceae bacterium]